MNATNLSRLLEDLVTDSALRVSLVADFEGIAIKYDLSSAECAYITNRLDNVQDNDAGRIVSGPDASNLGMSKYNRSRPLRALISRDAGIRPRLEIITNSDYYVRPVTVVTNTTTTNTVTFTTTTTTTTTTTSPSRKPTDPRSPSSSFEAIAEMSASIKRSGASASEIEVFQLATLLAEA